MFRGLRRRWVLERIASLVVRYTGALAVLHALGLVVRGWLGWVLILLPLASMVAIRLWVWQRISVEVRDGLLRYEGDDPRRDFEVPLVELRATYVDHTLHGQPLVLVLEEGERTCSPLSPSASLALATHLSRAGVPRLDGPRASTD